MRHILSRFIISFALLMMASVTHAEELQDFLKRVGTGDATQSDLHTNFHGSVFIGGQVYETDRDKLVEFWKQQKASGIKLAVDSFTIVANTETPDDDGR